MYIEKITFSYVATVEGDISVKASLQNISDGSGCRWAFQFKYKQYINYIIYIIYFLL